MSPKEKAEEFIMDFKIDYTMPYIMAKKCALIAVDRILDTLKSCWDEQGALNMYNYYYLVKQEIEKI